MRRLPMQVITHAATIQRLQTADAAVSRLQETVDRSLRDKTEAEAKQVGFSLIIAFAELRDVGQGLILSAAYTARHDFQI